MAIDPAYNNKDTSLISILANIAALWIVAEIGYYIFLPALGFGGGYTANPIAITIYYLFWLFITVFAFWNIYNEWRMFGKRLATYFFTIIASAGVVFYIAYILPLFPPITWANLKPPSELLIATPWYFLPKSIDILFQQLLVSAMVIAFAHQKFPLREISVWCALLFGTAHLFLVFGKESLLYVTVFTVSAIIASFIFPYFILKVKNGFIYSYFLHWLFYAVVIILVRLIVRI